MKIRNIIMNKINMKKIAIKNIEIKKRRMNKVKLQILPKILLTQFQIQIQNR